MTIIITDEDVKRLLPMQDCIEAMRVAFRDFADGSAVNRPRMRYLAQHPDPERKYLANVHVGAVPSAGIACVRAGSQIIRPPSAGNDRRLYENPQAFNWGIVILYSIETAEPLALMHEFQLSGMRVGATTAVGVDQVARPDAATLGLFGTGKQARCALEAIAVVRPLRRVNVYSPDAGHRADFAREMARGGIDVVAVQDPKAVVAGADIVCCATTAMKPVLDGDWLEDGQVVVSIANSDVTNKRSEVDRRTYERASAIIINDWESVIDNDQTELLRAARARRDPQGANSRARRSLDRQGADRGCERRRRDRGSSITRTIQAWRFSLPRRAASCIARRSRRATTRRSRPNGWAATCPPITRPAFDLRPDGKSR